LPILDKPAWHQLGVNGDAPMPVVNPHGFDRTSTRAKANIG
jgi:hypothetical protein